MMILRTNRLHLRRLQAFDIEALIELWCDPDVTRYLGGPKDRARLKDIFEQDAKDPYAHPYDLWPLINSQSNQVIGHCGLLEKEVDGKDEIEIVYILKRSAWGQGYATEIAQAIKAYAFEQLKLERLIALIEPQNGASEQVALKMGMELEKQVLRPGGEVRKLYSIDTTMNPSKYVKNPEKK